MPSIRSTLFQIHLWVGLIAGIFFILLGLSGSALVYPGLLQSSVPVPKVVAQGTPLPLEQVITAAREAVPQNQGGAAVVTLPKAASDSITVQFNAQRGGRGEEGAGRREIAGAENRQNAEARGPQARRGTVRQIFVDPFSGQAVGTATITGSPLVGLAHQMHEAMLLGAGGRTLVTWLGVGMLFLGLSGLYLWWPKKGQWKSAFGVRRTARGFRLYREIHGMMGIWFWFVFLFVTATSIPLAFPSVLGMLTDNAPRGAPPGITQAQTVQAPEGATPLRLADLIRAAEKISGAKVASLTVPAQPDRAVTVALESGDANVALNPYTGAVLAAPGQTRTAGLSRRTIEQLHGGQGFGPLWKFLVFLSGYLPLIFVTTGFLMWLKKRQNRAAMSRPVSTPVLVSAAAAARTELL